jgi:hypothetical protein
MAEYRAYLIGSDGHFYDAFPLTCADDIEAIEMAKLLAIDHDVELWQLDRKIGTFSLKQKWHTETVNHCTASSSYWEECVAMIEKSDRKELERRLEQAKRAAALGNDPVTTERLQKLVKDLEEQLRLSE